MVIVGDGVLTGAGTGNGGGGVWSIFERSSGDGKGNAAVGGGGRNGGGIKPDELLEGDGGIGKNADGALNGGGGKWAKIWRIEWFVFVKR